jgi:hypothetical protein
MLMSRRPAAPGRAQALALTTPLAYHPPFALLALLLVGPLALLALLLVGPFALLAANALAAWPQHRAARVDAGRVLRSE